MIQIGHWTGYYSFLNPEINKSRGFEQTFFDIEILTVDKNQFNGIVTDDLSTGGMKGTGEINGKIDGNRIEFIKEMPVMTLIVDKNGSKKTFDKKHRPVYYSGYLSTDQKSFSGQWKFKFGFIWFGIIPIPMIPTKGPWSMKFDNKNYCQ